MLNQPVFYICVTVVAAFLLAVLLGKVLVPALRRLKAGQSIREVGPKWHNSKAGTPTMGGIVFILASLVCMLTGIRTALLTGEWTHALVFVFALAFGLIGFADDFIKVVKKRNLGLTSWQKLVLQLLASAGYLVLLYFLKDERKFELWIPFTSIQWTINPIVYILFSVFVIVGTVNAVNLTDGIDGLATGVTIPVMIFFTVAAIAMKKFSLAMFPAALTGALAGFLFYNFYPAKTFMGDTGSLFLGGAVCGLAFALDMPLILILVGLIYIVETLSVILQVGYFKLTHGKRIFKMTPIHHHFEMSGWSEKKIWFVFVSVSLVCAVVAWFAIQPRL